MSLISIDYGQIEVKSEPKKVQLVLSGSTSMYFSTAIVNSDDNRIEHLKTTDLGYWDGNAQRYYIKKSVHVYRYPLAVTPSDCTDLGILNEGDYLTLSTTQYVYIIIEE